MQQAALFSNRVKHFFTFERIFLLIFLLAIVLRFSFLDLKLFHHDEAIHAWFSYDLLTKGTWQYDPSYHGPLLYYVTAGMFAVFGQSDLVGRLIPALLGTLLIPLVYAIYRIGYLTKTQTLFAALFLAISPDMVFFSRFLRHDIFMLFFTLLLVVALLYYFERKKTFFAVIAAVAMAGALCCKEEMPVLILIFAAFFIYEVSRGKLVLPPHWKKDLVLGIIIVLGLMGLLYSAFGAHPETLLTGWLEAIKHWTDMHNQQRLGGPWFYYVPLYFLYELPIFLLAMMATIQFIVTGFTVPKVFYRVKNWISHRRFELSCGDLAHVSVLQMTAAQKEGSKSDEFFRFCIWWMILSMAFYAYVGEKVPWLLIHQLLPMCFVAVYKLNWQKVAFALIGFLFLIVMMSHVAFVPADINEPIIQVQNSEEMRDVMQLMDSSDKVVVASKNYWPLPWYYRGDRWNKITFYGDKSEIATMTKDSPGVIILHDAASYPSIDGYSKKTYKLSYWFSFYDNEQRLPEYYFSRDGQMGSINLDVFTRD